MIECDDVLVPVGKEARITARLTLKHKLRLGFKLKGRVISFSVEGEKIGEARAGWDGSGTQVYTPCQEKEYRVVARYEGLRKREAGTAEAIIFSRSTRREAIILDLDRTLSGSSTFGSVLKKRKSIPPVRDAVDVTKALARKYDLIVVTGRSYLRHKTKRWLAEQGFPRAPIYFSSFGRFALSHEKFNSELIRELRLAWENITIGIGDRDSDARAYLANGLRAIILREKGRCPPGAEMVADWQTVGDMLLG